MTTRVHIRATELNAAAGEAPEWVQLLPPGPAIEGRDGRRWILPDAVRVVEAFLADPKPLPIDFEHATQVRGERGEPAPAVGWVTALEARDTGLWGRVEWNADGREAVASRAYRFLSPVFLADKASGAIARLLSAGLTNLPNLRMAALNRSEKETPMDDLPRLAAAAGLAETTGADELVAAINRLREAAETPDLARFVPRADHEQALNRAATAEGELARIRAEAAERAVADAVDAAIAAGKVAPASRDYHLAACRAEGGLEKFRAFVAAAAPIVTPAIPAAKPDGGPSALSEEERYACRQLGIEPAEFLKLKTAEA